MYIMGVIKLLKLTNYATKRLVAQMQIALTLDIV